LSYLLFLDDLRGFSSKTLWHNYLNLQDKTSILCSLDFKVHSWTQKELEILPLMSFITRRITSEREEQGTLGGPKRAHNAAQVPGHVVGPNLGPEYRLVSSFLQSLCPVKNLCLNLYVLPKPTKRKFIFFFGTGQTLVLRGRRLGEIDTITATNSPLV
jgi:hypothetical protein